MLSIKNLTAGYDGPIIIENIHLQISEGEIVTMIGPNGAGKSTVLKSIFGLTQITSGEILFFNKNLIGRKTSQIAGEGICYVLQGRSVFPSLTVEENLLMGAYIKKDKNEIACDLKYVYEKFPRLHERRNLSSRLLSGGEQQMVALGRALMLRPKLLLLDEPSIGLAPKIVAEVFEKILQIRSDGASILIVEQNATAALEISDRAYVLELGKNKFDGPAKELLTDKRIGEVYLGKK